MTAESKAPLPRALIGITGATFLLLVTLFGSRWLSTQSSSNMLNAPVCQLAAGEQECTFQLKDSAKTMSFRLASPHISLTEPTPFVIRVSSGWPVDRVEMDLQGRDMYMGLNHSEAVRQAAEDDRSSTSGGSLFSGHIVVPACTTGAMVWQALITATSGNQTFKAAIEFKAPQ
ncbi:hypothetical protein QCD60_21600 [Pokkaliibacter sp. MBI-7]|uniref:hypothetical protein n=1 Tax=Pokkaliibacter sp. MBI-7 TaxID=3040600 RepID=UPI0024480630|nr:hypothetical protein [Pokkaliibacter sp. MBI-7]MDH2435126.1 hypothetical protein [Pokkaliibacter sp. MBI-7]